MDDSRTAGVAALFDALAPSYDSVGVEFFGPIASGLVRAMDPVPGERWWDIGCGRGAVVERVAPVLGPRGTVLASDISPTMVSLAGAASLPAGSAPVTYFVDDAQAPDASRGLVDAVSASLVLFFLPAPQAAVAAWRALLAPEGRVGVTTFGAQDERWVRIDDLFTPYLPPGLLDARTSGTRGPFASSAGMAELLESAGFQDVTSTEEEIEVRFAGPDSWHDFTWSTGQRGMWLAVPEADRPALRARAEQILAETTAHDGSVHLVQTVRHTVGRVR